jgi:DNA mismatch repair protein MutL
VSDAPTPPVSADASDGLVRVLDDVLASKIAAGEVVQRPASVAKELIENALDAGATHVELILKKAGSELIQIVDDGCGMGPQDAIACFGRHATSKLRAIGDLERLATLGFRGEALASIAAVAQVELRTRRVQDAAGTRLRVDGGVLSPPEPCATPTGTAIAVRNLFFNVPARRNFLKTPATEFKHLVETFQTQALAHPMVGFMLVHDEMEVYRLAAATEDVSFEQALAQRASALFGDVDPVRLVPVEETTSYLSVRGLVGRPDAAKRSRGGQFVFVNERPIKNRSLEHAVTAAYGELLPEGRYPFFTLFLTVDPRHVDVNVHPAKTEVKFDDERGVYGFLKAVVKKGLAAADLAFTLETPTAATVTVPATGFATSLSEVPEQDSPTAPGFASDLPDSPHPVSPVEGDGYREHPVLPSEPSIFAQRVPASPRSDGPIPSRMMPGPETAEEKAEGELLAGERTIWQLHHRYILTPIATGLMMLDQQAVHERILYERALTAMEGGMSASQQLLFPHTLDFDPADFELLKELLPDLRSLGFDLELLSGRSVLVRGVPSEVTQGNERTILEGVLAQYRANHEGFNLGGRENLARSIARRSAIKPGHPLTAETARILIDQLFACRMPYADPAGRPTMVKIPMEELERRFSRSAGR